MTNAHLNAFYATVIIMGLFGTAVAAIAPASAQERQALAQVAAHVQMQQATDPYASFR